MPPNQQAAEARCTNTGILNSCGKSATSAPLRASYSHGGISVNWNAGSRITSGKISLINAKGATVVSSSIRTNSNNINVKLGSKATLPAGMYFIRVDARDMNGKRIVQQVPVQIVK
jgi:hypothetical protein